MPFFLHQVSYTPEAIARLIANPQDRLEAVRGPIEKLGGKIKDSYFAFGEHDVVVITEMPDNVSAAAIALAFAGGRRRARRQDHSADDRGRSHGRHAQGGDLRIQVNHRHGQRGRGTPVVSATLTAAYPRTRRSRDRQDVEWAKRCVKVCASGVFLWFEC